MKKLIITTLFVVCTYSVAHSQNTKEEKALKALIDAGMVRKEGDVYYFKVKDDREAATYKLLYSGLIDNPNSRMKFEYPNQKTQSNSQTNTNQTQIGNTTDGLNTTGMANVDPSQISQFQASTCCFCNIKSFGFVGAGNSTTAKSEHTFKVPPGITKLKVEAWSAGGNGWTDTYAKTKEYDHEDTRIYIVGGGGGSGSYYYGIINVFPGDIVTITIPGGGSTVPLQVRIANKGMLKLSNGKTAFEEKRPNSFNAKGGRIDMKSGIFEENYFALNGVDGQEALLLGYQDLQNNNPHHDGIGAPTFGKPDLYDSHGGDGGNAPKSTVGGAGYKTTHEGDYGENKIPAQDGGFPGGGGGGGFMEEGAEFGKGASGLVLIHY